MKCELVTATTSDLVRLHGLYLEAPSSSQSRVDGAVILHGLGSNFYSSKLSFQLAQTLTGIGVGVSVVNTRGHDAISSSTVSGRATTIGSAYEMVSDCRHDVRGWVDWMIDRGHQKVAVVGHSLGAIKSLYAQAFDPHAHVTALVALSASRLFHQGFLDSEHRERFLYWFNLATNLVGQGKGEELLQVDFPFPSCVCARAYADKYGPQNNYHWLGFVSAIECPLLMIFGERELADNAAFQGLLEDIKPVQANMPNLTVHVVESADHFYAGVHHRASDAMKQWLLQTG